jgi:hypothetical protein
MSTVTQITQNHLSVLVLDKDSHSPIVRMPIYAELSIVEETTIGSGGISLVDGSTNEGQEESDESGSSANETASEILLRRSSDLVGGSTNEGQKAIYSYPLGYLATDHVGYASFDLTQISSLIRSGNSNLIASEGNGVRRSYAIFVYPMGKEGERFDALEQGRFTEEAIFAKLSIQKPALVHDLRILNLPSMQKPSLIDWYFSPGSFTAHPEVLVGEDGCERLLPAQIALQEFNVRQVVRVVGDSPASLPEEYKFAYVDDYRVTWHSLGHSLGEILYSLPLAPGESVKLAVIDWSWESTTQRTEQTVLTEEILHQTHRDRTISETVKAGLRELQRGSSFMGGVATSAGGSGSTGAIGIAIGNAWSLGGSTATSEGSRDLIAENVQRLNDSFSQASSSQREINSTVVIQSRQEEKESIQTRTFTNYNHSHTLTILYYEVLRHFKVIVEWVRRRPAVLVNYKNIEFDNELILKYRYLLENALLDPRLKDGFDALNKLVQVQNFYNINSINPNLIPPKPFSEGDIEFSLFEFGVKTAEGLKDKTDELVMLNAIVLNGSSVERPLLKPYIKGEQPADNNINLGYRFNDTAMGWFIVKSDSPIKWRNLIGFEFVLHDSDEWRMDRLAVNAFHTGGSLSLLENADVDYLFLDNGSSNTVTFIRRPGPDLPTPEKAKTPEQTLSPEEYLSLQKLKSHLKEFSNFYSRLIAFSRDSNDIAIDFQQRSWTGSDKLIDHVEPYPLEAFGSYIAYPFIDVNNELSEVDLAALKKRSEKLATLPTRGVFAEGKLGHCNISEEIDNTRFWKWEEHPIPFEAPGINPVTPITPQPQQTDATPTAFPSSLVNIVNPSAAPDPSGLAAALTVLGTPNIFRDMSGQQEVADLLKKLSDNTISIAEAANKAREIQKKYGSSGGLVGGASSTIGGVSSGNEVSRPRPNQPSNANQDLHDAQHIFRRAQEQGLMTPEVSRGIYETMARERLTPQEALARGEQVTNISSNITDVSLWVDLIQFVPPSSVISALNARNIKVQSIYDGMGDLNVDFYAVRIKRMPSQGGNLMSQEQLLNHIRTNFNDFIDTSNSSFSPLESMDGPKWLSNDPIGAVLMIDILGPDNAAVVASEYSPNHWRFCTVETPFSQTGSHPVSGTREWGIRPSGAGYLFYTRGADRATKILETLFGEIATFPGADALWRSLQKKVTDFINQNQGEAEILSPYSKRHSWSAVRTLYNLSPQNFV